jgi:Leucine-rich repeat (LRR) protein
LHENKINEIPPGIKKLSYLAYLHLYDNKIINLPEEIGELESLEKLDIRNNLELSSLPTNLNDREDLTILIDGTEIDLADKKRAKGLPLEDGEGGGGSK